MYGVIRKSFREQHQLAVRTGFEPATYGFQIRRSNHSATLPPNARISLGIQRKSVE